MSESDGAAEEFMSVGELLTHKDEQIARLKRMLTFATDEIESMRQDMAGHLPSIADYVSVEVSLDLDMVRIDGPRNFASLMPVWQVPAKERASVRTDIIRRAAEVHCRAVYDKILKAYEEKQAKAA